MQAVWRVLPTEAAMRGSWSVQGGRCKLRLCQRGMDSGLALHFHEFSGISGVYFGNFLPLSRVPPVPDCSGANFVRGFAAARQ
ncbi:MAG: hypothetical protein RL215_182 [Planctomycetota bacterium]|jgi:hypothetical protein